MKPLVESEQLELFDLKPWTQRMFACYYKGKHHYFYHGTMADEVNPLMRPPPPHPSSIACWPVEQEM